MKLRLVLLAAALSLAVWPLPTTATDREQADFEHIAELDELTDNHARVLRLYWAYFDRKPDPGGAMYWIDQLEACRSLRDIASFFTDSPEFSTTYGELTEEGFVDLVYANVLDRTPDEDGQAYWIERLSSGAIDRTRLMLDFSFSPEFVDSHPLPSDGVPGRPCRAGVAATGPQKYELQDWAPFATVGPLSLRLPSPAVAQIGFHQSNHDGARQMMPTNVVVPVVTMEDRGRDTVRRGAADVAVHPMHAIRAPVSGTVIRGGGYILYCNYTDDYLVIEPTGRPGWEVKLLHITGLRVGIGDQVEAGVTVVADGGNILPFRSQIDRYTAEPSWAHVHIEVVDPSIPDRPSPGGSC